MKCLIFGKYAILNDLENTQFLIFGKYVISNIWQIHNGRNLVFPGSCGEGGVMEKCMPICPINKF